MLSAWCPTLSLLCPHGVLTVFPRCPHDVPPYGVPMVPLWCPQDVLLMSLWCLHGDPVVTPWCPWAEGAPGVHGIWGH